MRRRTTSPRRTLTPEEVARKLATHARRARTPPLPTRIAFDDGAIIAELPLHLVNPLNNRQHWSVVSAKAKTIRTSVRAAIATFVRRLPLPIVVTIVRVSAGTLDGDGLQASAKPVRDSVADAYGVDDRDSGPIEWRYAQAKCMQHQHGVRVEIRAKESEAA